MIAALQTLVDNGLSDKALDAALEDLIEGDSFEDDDDRRMCIALAWYRENEGKADPDTCSIGTRNDVVVGGNEYWVLTDDEADDAFDDYLESCLEDEGIVPGGNGPYFDREEWKSDAKIDGRGRLSGYDGAEQEYSTTDGWWYLYRTN
jgi:hypothetical protein